MKVECVNPTFKGGAFGTKVCQAKGLTLGKTYEVQAVPILCNWTSVTDIDLNDIKFLLFNDHGEWEVYPKSCFKPREG